MFETLKKKAMKSVIISSIVMFAIGIALIIFMGREAYYGIVGYEVFEDLEPDEIKNQLVDVTLTLNFDYYIEEYEKNTQTGRTRSTYYYYVILTGDEYAQDVRFMSIKVPASYHSRMEKMCENTYAGYYSDPIEFSGHIRKLSSEDYAYFKEFFTSGPDGYTEEEFEAYTLPYYIQVTASKSSMTAMGLLISGLGLVLIIVGIVRIIRAAGGAQVKSFQAAIAEAGYTEAMVESDYNAAQTYDKKGDIRVGRLFIYYMTGATLTAIPNNKILWAYQTTTTHRRNGIKTGTTYSVTIYADAKKNCYTINVANEAMAFAILEKISKTLPWVVIGYSEDIRKLFNKDRAQFLSLRYNTVEHIAVDEAFTAQNTYAVEGSASPEQNTISGPNQ